LKETEKKDGQFTGSVYTPYNVAQSMVAHCKEILGDRKELRVLEPSVGDGVFARALNTSEIPVLSLTVVDLDQNAIEQLKLNSDYLRFPIKFHHCDFIEIAIKPSNEAPPDLIIGNPPFIRFRNFSDEFKNNTTLLANKWNVPAKEMRNAWAVFLHATEKILSSDGLLAFILPYEILTVAYGQQALQFLQEMFHRVDIHVSRKKVFPEIEQDTVIVFANRSSKFDQGLFLHKNDSFSSLPSNKVKKIKLVNGPNRGLEMNAFFFDERRLDELREIRQNCSSISDFASSSPGLVTAANDFFIRTLKDVKELCLENFAQPIIKRSSFNTSSPIFRKADYERIASKEPSQFLHFQGDFALLPDRAQNYILEGKKLGLHLRFKCKNRENWFEVNMVKPQAGFIFKRSHSYPRLVINKAVILTTDSAYGITPHEDYSIEDLCFSFYNSLTLLFAELDGRFYGGGVLELTPKEFRGLPLVFKKPSKKEFSEFLKIHRLAKGNPEPILDFGDKWLGNVLNIDRTTLIMLRKCWKTVRAHRLRHGRL